MTYKETLEQYFTDNKEKATSCMYGYNIRNYVSDFPDTAAAETVEHYGGEYMGSDYYSICKFVSHAGEVLYIKFQGWYQSHCGTDYQGFEFVTPVTKTVTVYE